MAQRVGRGIALLFHDRRGEWSAARLGRTLPPGKTPGLVWTGGKSRPHRYSIPDRPARSSVAIPSELLGPYSMLREIILPTREEQQEDGEN